MQFYPLWSDSVLSGWNAVLSSLVGYCSIVFSLAGCSSILSGGIQFYSFWSESVLTPVVGYCSVSPGGIQFYPLWWDTVLFPLAGYSAGFSSISPPVGPYLCSNISRHNHWSSGEFLRLGKYWWRPADISTFSQLPTQPLYTQYTE